MSRIIIEKKIYLDPSLLDEKVQNHIYNRICQEMSNHCDQTYGYILKIYPKFQIIENIVSSTGPGVFFHVRLGIDTLKPSVGESYPGVVCLIFPQGIFIEVAKRMKVLVPADKLVGYKYDKIKNVFKKDDKTISKDDEMSVIVDMFKYEKQNFNCIGSLKTL